MYDYVENLKKCRFTVTDREMGGITSHKVLAVNGNNVIIGVPPVLSKNGKISVVMSDTSGIEPGICLDFQFAYTVRNGTANSYQTRFLGVTPSGFSPKGRATYTK